MIICKEYETLNLLKCVLTNTPLDTLGNIDSYDWGNIYEEIQAHAIVPMVGLYLKNNPSTVEEQFAKRCMDSIVSNFSNTVNVQREECKLCELFKRNNINSCILKGSAANVYYPSTILRSFGDADLLVAPENFERAAKLLIDEEYKQLTELYEDPRNVTFKHGQVEIELHRCFFKDDYIATDSELYAVLDKTQTVQIRGRSAYILPDKENGLVLIDHIRQHLFGGLGLRQIIDWYMYCNAVCDDVFWNSQMDGYLQDFELKQLAMCVTKLCKKYLGLSDRITWCDEASEKTVDELMLFIMENGNFGRKKEKLDSVIADIVSRNRTFDERLKHLHETGLKHWKAAQKYEILRHFAGIYQLFRYLILGLKGGRVFKFLKSSQVKEVKSRQRLYAGLGIK